MASPTYLIDREVVGDIESDGSASTEKIFCGFKPDFVFVVATLLTANGLDTSATWTCLSWGIAKSTGVGATDGMQWFEQLRQGNAYPTSSRTGMFDMATNGIGVLYDDDTQFGGNISAWNDDGFDWEWTFPLAGMKVYYIAHVAATQTTTDGLLQEMMFSQGVDELPDGAGLFYPASVGVAFLNGRENDRVGTVYGGFMFGGRETSSIGVGGFTEFSTLGAGFGGSEQHVYSRNQFLGPTIWEPIVGAFLIGYNTDGRRYPSASTTPTGASSGWRSLASLPNSAFYCWQWACRNRSGAPPGFGSAADVIQFRAAQANVNVTWAEPLMTAGAVFTHCPAPFGVGNTAKIGGTGFGIHGQRVDGSLMDIHVGIGRNDALLAYSWRYEDRSYIAAFDRTIPAPTDYGTIRNDFAGTMEWVPGPGVTPTGSAIDVIAFLGPISGMRHELPTLGAGVA